jgi:DNA-directed RNA polymerase
MDRDMYLEQQELELEQSDQGVSMYFKSRDGLAPSFGTPERRTISYHVHMVKNEIEKIQLNVLENKRMPGVRNWGVVLLSQDAEKLAVITLNRMWNCYGMSLNATCMDIARCIKEERRIDNLRHTDHDIWKKVRRFKNNLKGSSFYKYRNQIKGLDESWSKTKSIWVGHTLLECVLRASGLFHIEKHRGRNGHRQYFLSIDPEILLGIEEQHGDLALLHPRRMPMVVPPVDWENRWHGGYLACVDKESCHTPLVSASMYHRLPHNDAEDFGDHMLAVNALQKTTWQVNEPLQETISHVFHHNLELGGLLRRDPDPYPDKPEDISWNEDSRKNWKEEARQVGRYNKAMLGARTSMLIAIDQSKRFKRYNDIHYVWFLDWRGRMSPRGGAWIPQGDDACKAMLRFKEGHALGERGVFWLTVHLANCMGYDKKPFDERVQYVHTMADEIHRWAKDPLEYKSWADQDDPYLCLAAAMEWSAAHMGRVPADFISHLPINMDGTTNGLQHLSALGRDLVGARATNLCPVDRPNDIYGQVAGECNKIIERDYQRWVDDGCPSAASVVDLVDEEDIARARKIIGAANWIGRVDRKVCKRATMTRAYSVTRQGVRRQLVDDGFLDFSKDDPEININIAADYMRDCIWNAQEAVVANASYIMDWLKEAARRALEEGQSIAWRTPAGMLVHQGYLRPLRKEINTAERKYTVLLTEGERKLMARKQINAVAPNYIHSLDAAHLTRVVLRLEKEGIKDMMMIHDSYGVHACHVDTMQRIIREEFVRMHEENPLADFKAGLEAYLDNELPDLPETGAYDIKDMLEAQYAFC